MLTLIFESPEIAQSVSEHIYHCSIDFNAVSVAGKEAQRRALELAASLEAINLDCEEEEFFASVGACCRLPMPEFDYDSSEPMIWVDCLAAYNQGRLFGAWMSASRDVDEILEDIQIMLSYSPVDDAGEWQINDADNFGDISVEKESLETISQLALILVDLDDENEKEAFCGFYKTKSCSCDDPQETFDKFRDSYRDVFRSEESYAYHNWSEQGLIKEAEKIGIPEYYLDFEAIARDLFLSSFDSVDTSGGIFVFENY